MQRIEPAVDTAGFRVTLGREEIGQAGGTVQDLQSLLERLAAMPQQADAKALMELIERLLANPSLQTRVDIGGILEDRVSSWGLPDPIDLLAYHLEIANAIDNLSTSKCVRISLRRIQQGVLNRGPEDHSRSIELLVDVILAHYRKGLDDELRDLRDVFFNATAIPFPSLARIGGCLVVGNKARTQFIHPKDMVRALFARQRTSRLLPAQKLRAVHSLVKDHEIDKWKSWLPLLHFDGASDPETKECCSSFLKLCFDPSEPALLMPLLPTSSDGESWFARTIDLSVVEKPSRGELERLIREKGVSAPEIPADEDEDLEDKDEFFERVANARKHANIWMTNHTNTVVPFRPNPGGRR